MTEKLIELQEFQNEIKKRMKKAFYRIDDQKQGVVRKDVFFQILEVLEARLSQRDQARIIKKFEKTGFISYLEPIRYIQINPQTQAWEYRHVQGPQKSSFSSLERSHILYAKAGTLNTSPEPRNNTDYTDREDPVQERASVTLSNFETIWENQQMKQTKSAARSRQKAARGRTESKGVRNSNNRRLNQTALSELSNNQDLNRDIEEVNERAAEETLSNFDPHRRDQHKSASRSRAVNETNVSFGRKSRNYDGQTRASVRRSQIASIRSSKTHDLLNNTVTRKSVNQDLRSSTNMSKSFTQNNVFKSKQKILNEQHYLKKVVQKLKKYHINPHTINGLRYELQRFDSAQSNIVQGQQFKEIYRQFNISMNSEDQQLLFDYLCLHAPGQDNGQDQQPVGPQALTIATINSLSPRLPRTDKDGFEMTPQKKNKMKNSRFKTVFNMLQVDKLVDRLSVEFGEDLWSTNQDMKQTKLNMYSLANHSTNQLEMLLEAIVSKLRINFGSPQEAYRFFDINCNGKCKREHFTFLCQYFSIENEENLVCDLFDILDFRKDGVLDEAEFLALFSGMQDGWNSHEHHIMGSVLRGNQRGVERLTVSNENQDINLAMNTHNKFGPTDQDLYEYPHFFKLTKQSRSFKPQQPAHVTAPHSHKKRTLSILGKDGRVITASSPSVRDQGAKTALLRNYNTVVNSDYSFNAKKVRPSSKHNRTSTRNFVNNEIGDQYKTSQVWTKDSVVDVGKMTQPDTFSKLLAGKYANDHVDQMKENDRINYLNNRLMNAHPRIFKNYVETNSNQLRKEIQLKKLQRINNMEQSELHIQDYLKNNQTQQSFHHRIYNPTALKLLRPTHTINKLMKETTGSKNLDQSMGFANVSTQGTTEDDYGMRNVSKSIKHPDLFRKTSLSLQTSKILREGNRSNMNKTVGFQGGIQLDAKPSLKLKKIFKSDSRKQERRSKSVMNNHNKNSYTDGRQSAPAGNQQQDLQQMSLQH